MTHSRTAHLEAAGPTETVIRLRDVGRSFVSPSETVWAVREATLDIRAGMFVCVFGASGSGKSTLLNLMAGLDLPTTGTVEVAGHDIGALSERQRSRLRLERIGVVFQDHNLIEEFSAAENVMLPMEVLGLPVPAARSAAMAMLERVGMAGFGERYPAQLSGGQRQRVGVARALAGSRRILLADEPTGSLDSTTSRAVFDFLGSLRDDGTTVVVATHDLMSREYADEVVELADGRPRVLARPL